MTSQVTPSSDHPASVYTSHSDRTLITFQGKLLFLVSSGCLNHLSWFELRNFSPFFFLLDLVLPCNPSWANQSLYKHLELSQPHACSWPHSAPRGTPVAQVMVPTLSLDHFHVDYSSLPSNIWYPKLEICCDLSVATSIPRRNSTP